MEQTSDTQSQLIQRMRRDLDETEGNVTLSKILTFLDLQCLMQHIGNKELHLLYRMTRNGPMCADFHSRCDNQGPTVCLFKSSTGRRCAGYTSASWESGSAHYKADATAFLLNFASQQRINVAQTDYAICCGSIHGPNFGGNNLGADQPFNRVNQGYSNRDNVHY